MLLSEKMREQRQAKKASLDALVATCETRDNKTMTDEESAQFDAIVAEIRTADARIVELEAAEASEARSAATRVETGEAAVEQRTAPARVEDPPVYVPNGGNGNSYFRDMAKRALGTIDAHEAIDRLSRSNKATLNEQRALGNTNTTGGSGGEFAPPVWMVDEYINIARGGRVAAELMQKGDVPFGVSSINLPKLTTGTSVALQSTQNSALSQTDLATSYVSTGFATLGGKQVVSQQIIDQSAVPFDRVVLADLADAYSTQVGINVLSGAGTGANNNSVVNGLLNATPGSSVTFTQASPTAAQFYGAAAQAVSQFETTRFVAPTAWLMHPRRYWWLASKSDSNGRPLIVPTSAGNQSVNSMGVLGNPSAPGLKGEFLGLPVYVDPNIPTNLGAGTNQDIVFLAKWDDLWFFESPLQVEAFREPYADSVGVLFRAYSYVGTILNRRAGSLATIGGTGLVTPVYG